MKLLLPPIFLHMMHQQVSGRCLKETFLHSLFPLGDSVFQTAVWVVFGSHSDSLENETHFWLYGIHSGLHTRWFDQKKNGRKVSPDAQSHFWRSQAWVLKQTNIWKFHSINVTSEKEETWGKKSYVHRKITIALKVSSPTSVRTQRRNQPSESY